MMMLAVALCTVGLASATPVVERLDARHGLPGAHVEGLALTPDGALFMALGERGLARVGGPKRRLRTWDRLDPSAAEPDVVSDVATDASGALWVATARGLFRADLEGETFTRVGPEVEVRDLVPAPSGGLWVEAGEPDHWTAVPLASMADMTRRELLARESCAARSLRARDDAIAYLDCSTKVVQLGARGGFTLSFVGTPLGRVGYFDDVAVTPDGDLWLVTWGSLWRSRDSWVARVLPRVWDSTGLAVDGDGHLLGAGPDTDHMIGPGSFGVPTVWRYDPERREVELWPLRREEVSSVRVVAVDGPTLWLEHFRMEGPRTIIRLRGREETRWRVPELGPRDRGSRILAALPDGHGGLWLGTDRSGLLHLRAR